MVQVILLGALGKKEKCIFCLIRIYSYKSIILMTISCVFPCIHPYSVYSSVSASSAA